MHARHLHLGVALRAREAQPLEDELHDQAGRDHGRVEGGDEEAGHPPAVVPAVDVDDRQDDQVGEDERQHAAEADPAVPEDRGERDVPDRADEAQDGDQRTYEWPPELRERVVALEEQGTPEGVWHPGGQGARDQEAPDNVDPDRGPVHHEVVGGRREPLGRAQPLP